MYNAYSLFIFLFVHSFIYSSIHLLIYSFIYLSSFYFYKIRFNSEYKFYGEKADLFC